MSGSDVIAAFESGKFDLDDAKSMISIPFCHLPIKRQKTLKCRQTTSVAKFLRARSKTFLDWGTINQRNYSRETVNIDKRLGGAVKAEDYNVEASQATGVARAISMEAFEPVDSA